MARRRHQRRPGFAAPPAPEAEPVAREPWIAPRDRRPPPVERPAWSAPAAPSAPVERPPFVRPEDPPANRLEDLQRAHRRARGRD